MNTIRFIRAFAHKYYFFTVTGLGHRLINTFETCCFKLFQVLKKYVICKYLTVNCPHSCMPNIPSRSLAGDRLHSLFLSSDRSMYFKIQFDLTDTIPEIFFPAKKNQTLFLSKYQIFLLFLKKED